jgi:septum formation protein
MTAASHLQPPLLLASGSRYRAQLLERIGISFKSIAPDVDESALIGETPVALAMRLAQLKAETLANRHRGHWVLGSDQVASCENQTLGKPGTHEQAVLQLRFLSGRPVEFLTAVALVKDSRMLTAIDHTRVRFRSLTSEEIERYLAAEPAYDCAGSFKCEGLGITLFEEIRSSDPTGLVGLPLIAVCRLLREAGYVLP